MALSALRSIDGLTPSTMALSALRSIDGLTPSTRLSMLLGALSEACGEHVPLRGARLLWLLCLKEEIMTQLRFLKTCKF